MKADNLGDRMKHNYEDRYRFFLTRRTPVIMRLDGKAFHTLTRGCEKPFDLRIIKSMQNTAFNLLENIQGAKVAYVQSDEITILITDYDTLETDAWFDYNVQKMCSVSSAMAAVFFTREYHKRFNEYVPSFFDSRVFNIPKEEVINNFRWRYKDWLRNSIQMLARSLYSHKQLEGKKSNELHDMCVAKGKNWNDLPPQMKNGTLICRIGDGIATYEDFNLNDNDFCNFVFKDLV